MPVVNRTFMRCQKFSGESVKSVIFAKLWVEGTEALLGYTHRFRTR